MDIAPDPDILVAVCNRHRVVVGLVAHQRLRRDPAVVLIAGIERGCGERAHRSKVTLQSLTDRLAFAAQDGALTFEALFFQPEVERLPSVKCRHRHHEVAPRIAHQAFDISLVVALARPAIAIPDQVVRQEPAEQRGALSGAIRQDLRHKASVVVVEHRLRNRAEEREGMDMAIHPGLGHCCGISPDVTGIAVRKVQHEEVRLLLNTTDPDQGLAEVGLCLARRMRQRHEHLLAPPLTFPNVVFDDRIAAGKPTLIAKPVEDALRRMPLLARHRPVRFQPALDDGDKRIEFRAPDLDPAPVTRRNRKRHHLPNRVPRNVE